jgi:hypothetical protein
MTKLFALLGRQTFKRRSGHDSLTLEFEDAVVAAPEEMHDSGAESSLPRPSRIFSRGTAPRTERSDSLPDPADSGSDRPDHCE